MEFWSHLYLGFQIYSAKNDLKLSNISRALFFILCSHIKGIHTDSKSKCGCQQHAQKLTLLLRLALFYYD